MLSLFQPEAVIIRFFCWLEFGILANIHKSLNNRCWLRLIVDRKARVVEAVKEV